MVLALHGLANKYSHVRDKLLGAPVVLTLASTCSTFFRVWSTHQWYTYFCWWLFYISILTCNRNFSCKIKTRCHKCDHYAKLSHKIERCYTLYGRPPQCIVVVHIDHPSQSPLVNRLSSDITKKYVIISKVSQMVWESTTF